MMKHSFYQRLSEPNKGMLFIFVYFDDHISILFVTAPSDSFSAQYLLFFNHIPSSSYCIFFSSISLFLRMPIMLCLS